MTPTTPKTSRDLPGVEPRDDNEREHEEALIKDAAEYDEKERDLVHGDGDTIGIPAKPSDHSKN